MSRPEHLNTPNTPEGIRRINEMQEHYDKDPQEYERQEQENRERQIQEEQEERARQREHDEERIQECISSDLPF